VGCQSCNHSGYKGRLGVFELLVITKPLADALRRSDIEGFSNLAYHSTDFISLGKMALDYAQQGITTLEEVIRVTEYLETEPLVAERVSTATDLVEDS
jgi:MSHA biogenesis protein MshE